MITTKANSNLKLLRQPMTHSNLLENPADLTMPLNQYNCLKKFQLLQIL